MHELKLDFMQTNLHFLDVSEKFYHCSFCK